MQSTDLTEFFSEDKPFGPIASPSTRDACILRDIFYKENLIFSELSKHPSLIIGRRGAGKTAFLSSTYISPEYKIIIELQVHKSFRDIIDSIGQLSTGLIFVEETSELWNILFWVSIFSSLIDFGANTDELKAVRKYLSGIGISHEKDHYNIMRTAIKVFKETASEKIVGSIASFIDKLVFNDIEFPQAKKEAIDFMKNKKIKGIILLDSLEDYQLDFTVSQHAIRGLLKCQGEFHFPGSPFEIRCCIPVEIYHNLLELSSNPGKDFQHKVLLHWHAHELIRLAAQRYLTYLSLHHDNLYKPFRQLDPNKRTDVSKFWHSIFPGEIKNRMGVIEDPIPYIMRHTQLLPRHLLMYMNAIARKNYHYGNSWLQLSEKAIVEGVYETEDTVCGQIFNGYKQTYPGAKKACERCLKELPFRFTDGDLQRVYTRHGKKQIPGIDEYEEFKRMLIEIGAVGRFIDETEHYIRGLFEYTIPHKLLPSGEDQLILHPCFLEAYSKKRKIGYKPIYPYGTEIETGEYRYIR